MWYVPKDLYAWIRVADVIGLSFILLFAWLKTARVSAVRPLRRAAPAILAVQLIATGIYFYHFQQELLAAPIRQHLGTWPSPFLIRHINTEITTLAMGWLLALAVFLLGRWIFLVRGKGVFLDGYDLGLLVLGAAAVGYPAAFVFLANTFLLSVLAMIALVAVRRKSINDRLIITPYIIPAAVVTLMFQNQLAVLTHLTKISF